MVSEEHGLHHYHLHSKNNKDRYSKKSRRFRRDFFIFVPNYIKKNIMNNVMLHAHRGFAYLILLATAVFVIALLAAMFGYSGKISKLLRKSTLFTMILFHTQALVGLLLLFFFSPGFQAAKESGMLMKDAYLRQTYVEHPTAMIISAILLTIVNKKMKSNTHLNFSIVGISILAIILMLWAFQWHRLFG